MASEVHRFNLHMLLPSLQGVIRAAKYIAIDTEFTGLGEPSKLRSKDLEERYANMRQLVDSHALVAFGISIFVPAAAEGEGEDRLRAHNFNFTLLRDTEFVVTPQSLMFLVDSGFDFNYQMRMGIPYVPLTGPHTSTPSATETSTAQARKDKNHPETLALARVFSSVLQSGVPIVVHNGLLDLMFLYRSFYGPLPSTLETFVADLSEMCPGGVYDTKYIADFHTREPASFLSFLYHKYQRSSPNTVTLAPEVVIPLELFAVPPLTAGQLKVCGDRAYCECFARHGFCKLGRRCKKTHDLDVILDDADNLFATKTQLRSRKRKRARKAATSASATGGGDEDVDDDDDEDDNGDENDDQAAKPAPTVANDDPKANLQLFVSKPEAYHAAGFDAFMTGVIFAYQRSKQADIGTHINKLYIMMKDFPLLVRKGVFAKASALHRYRQANPL